MVIISARQQTKIYITKIWHYTSKCAGLPCPIEKITNIGKYARQNVACQENSLYEVTVNVDLMQ